jgi:hypothetical protein
MTSGCVSQVGAMVAVGVVKGTLHVNKRVLAVTILWCNDTVRCRLCLGYGVGFALVMVSATALIAQGEFVPSVMSCGISGP